ncbi:MAG TPA: hypothetical protein VF183_07310 [Acidimicrobiales bacterium]
MNVEWWATAPYVLCEHCERETAIPNTTPTTRPVTGLEVDCEHCGSTLRVVETDTVVRVRAELVRLAPGAAFEDEDTPVESPRDCPNCGAKGVLYVWTEHGRARCPRCPKDVP